MHDEARAAWMVAHPRLDRKCGRDASVRKQIHRKDIKAQRANELNLRACVFVVNLLAD
jgi:hypothetical protein